MPKADISQEKWLTIHNIDKPKCTNHDTIDYIKTNTRMHLPNDDDGKIEQIPAVSEIRAGMHDETVCYDLHDAFTSKYN